MVTITNTKLVERTPVSSRVPKEPATIFPPFPETFTRGLVMAHLCSVLLLSGVVWAYAGFENVDSAMAFYGVYHREPTNQMIHFVGVPLILWTAMIFLAHLPLTKSIVISGPGIPRHYMSWATLSIVFYAITYIHMDTFGGLLYTGVWYIVYCTAVRWTREDQIKQKEKQSWAGTGRLLKRTAFFHLFAWYIQIHPGHKIFEGGQPALLDSLGGAIFSAPLFAFYEGIWYLGLRKELQERVLMLVEEYTAEVCAKGAMLQACSSVGV